MSIPIPPPPSDSRQARRSLVDTLRLDLVGPGNQHPCAREILPESPRQWYLTGYLVPTQAEPEEQQSGDPNDELDLYQAPNGSEPDQQNEPPQDARSLLPSSIGLSVLVQPGSEFTITARWGDYIREARPEREGENLVLERDENGDSDDANNDATRATQFRREPGEGSIRISLHDLEPNVPKNDFPSLDSCGLNITVVLRPLHDAARMGLPDGTQGLTVFLVNERVQPYPSYHGFAFQVELEISSTQPFIPQPDLRGLGHLENQGWDDRLADLQYRDIHDFAVGHGVATVSEIGPDGECRVARTTWIPEHEVEQVAPNLDISGVEFGIEALGAINDPVALTTALQPLVSQYREWIDQQEAALPGLSSTRLTTATEAIAMARRAAQRIEGGINQIANDPAALKAFGIANRAIVAAGSRRLRIPAGTLRWRPFQLAFILLNAPGIVNETHPDRETVDLLFFPTGGGKTEAYLGLAGFAMVLRRLRYPGISSAGLSVLMRYTLRLLTLDQLGRAAGMVCALELERKRER